MNSPYLADASTWTSGESSVLDQSDATPRIGNWRKTILWTVGVYLVLNSGFEMVRIPPVGAGVPMGELVLVCSLLIINLLVLLPKMAREVWLLPVLVWWGMSLSRALVDTSVGGAWSLRDASQAIESLYLIVGFWLVNNPANLQHFFRWLRRLFQLLAVYCLLLPFGTTLQKFSPKLPGMASGSSAALFFQTTNIATMGLWVACWLLIERARNVSVRVYRGLWAAILVLIPVALGQGRTIYMAVLAVGAILFLIRRAAAAKWAMILLFGVVIVGVISFTGLEIKGSRGHKVSLEFIEQQFETISGTAQSEEVSGSAAGVGLRLGWWKHIIAQMKESPRKMIFGLGYGIPLTDFHGAGGKIVREPHNSVISVGARLGVAGLLAWIFMQSSLYLSWWRSFQLCKRMRWTQDRNNLIYLLLFCILTFVGVIGEDVFEKPFNCIPYYFFFGIVLRYGRFLRQTALSQRTTSLG